MLFEQILSLIPCAVFWKNTQGIFQGCNNMFLEFAGLKNQKDLIGKTDRELPWKDRADKYFIDDQDVIASANRLTFIEDVSLVNKTIKANTTKMPWFQDNRIAGIIGVIYDVTEIMQAKEAAESASLAKTEFLTNVSHDIKTPISGVIGIATVLTSRLKGQELEFAYDLLESSKQIMEFFENCLELSKLDDTGFVANHEIFSLREIIESVFALMEPSAKMKELDFRIEYDSSIPSRFFGNRSSIYRILLNLVGNAMKFTRQGSVIIRTTLGKKSTSDRSIVKIGIEDTGIGIPKEKHGVIFERLTRLTPSYEGRYDGCGIGLYLVEKLVRQMEGEVYLKSEVGKGSIFSIVLPLQISLLEESEY